MAAQQVIFGVPRWNSSYGCSKCYIKGMRIGNQRVWIASSDADTVLRSRESYAADGEVGQYGIPKVTAVMRLLAPCDFLGDALHICSEGLTKDRMKDLFSTSSKFPDLRISRDDTEKIKRSLLGLTSHTYSNSLVLSIDDLPTCTASEVDELANVLFPLTAAVDVIPSPIAAEAKTVAQLTREIWIIVAPEVYTMKCHWFFDHGMEEGITSYGSLYQWTSTPFESRHRRLQIKLNQSITNSACLILDKFPVDIRISEHVYIPKYSRISEADLREPERTRVLRSCEEP
ncbi:hypothetical protein Aduo_018650 [Ancylostoma duodenale]